MDQPLPSSQIHYSLENVFAEKLAPGGSITQRWSTPGWVLDLAHNGVLEINDEVPLSAGFWRLSFNPYVDRKIRATESGIAEFLSIGIHENTYKELLFLQAEATGAITTAMTYSVIKIVSSLKLDRQKLGNNIWLKCYTQLLLNQLGMSSSSKRNYSCAEFKSVFQTISGLENISDAFPSPRELAQQTGMSQSRFQKICLAMYGQSAQKIIQHLKMKLAYNAILIDRKTISTTSSRLGYRHSPNFITAFRNHFCVTPMEAAQFGVNSYDLRN